MLRPNGYAYVHDVELDGDEDLHIGSHAEIYDESGSYVPATVDEITPDELRHRYTLHLGSCANPRGPERPSSPGLGSPGTRGGPAPVSARGHCSCLLSLLRVDEVTVEVAGVHR